MKAVRKIIEHADNSIFIEFPAELRNQKLEITILAASENQLFTNTPRLQSQESMISPISWEN